MSVNLLTGLQVHYDCEGITDLFSSTTFPPGAPTTNFVEQNTVPLVSPGKFGDARGALSGVNGFARGVSVSDPWDFRNGTQSFSVGCWVYLNSNGGSQILHEYAGTAENTKGWALRAAHDLGGGATSPAVFFRDNDLGNWNFAFSIPQDQSGIAGGQATGEWVYIATSFDATTKFTSLYYGSPTDGTFYATFDASAINSGNGPFNGWTSLADNQYLGIPSGGTGSVGTLALDGNIDHLDVWNRALTEAELGYAYNAGAGRTISNYVEKDSSNIAEHLYRVRGRRGRKRRRG